jgi:hypothetical protein
LRCARSSFCESVLIAELCGPVADAKDGRVSM